MCAFGYRWFKAAITFLGTHSSHSDKAENISFSQPFINAVLTAFLFISFISPRGSQPVLCVILQQGRASGQRRIRGRCLIGYVLERPGPRICHGNKDCVLIFSPFSVKVGISRFLHFPLNQLEPEKPSLLLRKFVALFPGRMCLCPRNPTMMFFAKVKHLWAAVVIVIQNVMAFCRQLCATFHGAGSSCRWG
jgi:hypothetical protein